MPHGTCELLAASLHFQGMDAGRPNSYKVVFVLDCDGVIHRQSYSVKSQTMAANPQTMAAPLGVMRGAQQATTPGQKGRVIRIALYT